MYYEPNTFSGGELCNIFQFTTWKVHQKALMKFTRCYVVRFCFLLPLTFSLFSLHRGQSRGPSQWWAGAGGHRIPVMTLGRWHVYVIQRSVEWEIYGFIMSRLTEAWKTLLIHWGRRRRLLWAQSRDRSRPAECQQIGHRPPTAPLPRKAMRFPCDFSHPPGPNEEQIQAADK